MIQVKVCGVCSAADAQVAVSAGASHVGVILAQHRKRSRTVDEAVAILEAADARRVGVFVDAPLAHVVAAARTIALDAVQLHGDESPAYIEELRRSLDGEIWKAIHVRSAADVRAGIDAYAGKVDAVLLEGWSPRGRGGMGAAFDWSGIANAAVIPPDLRVVVAGGLTPDNVATAVSILHPAIVDVSSGVEDAPGRKSAKLVHAFVAAARSVKESP